MKKNIIFAIVLFTLVFAPLSEAAAQTSQEPSESLVTFDMSGFPQWAKDFRRFDIIAFGSFPFSMFFVNFFYDLFLWDKVNGMDFSTAGRAYAPWPLKTAGGIEKTPYQFRNTIIMAVSLSLVFATVDLIIHKSKQKKELERRQSIPPSGSVNIIMDQGENVETEEHPPDSSENDLSDYPLE